MTNAQTEQDGVAATSEVAVVVGGGSGIGAAVADAQRAAGATVVVWDVNEPTDIMCDVTDADQVAAATESTLAAVGVPTTVTVTAGIGHGGWLSTDSVDDWDRVMGVNARGAWLAMRALAEPMRGGGGGSIVAISSVSSRLADRSMGIYGASKAALDMVVKVAALEWAPAVRVNAVAPGVTDTPMLGPVPRDHGWLGDVARRTPLGRLGEPVDVARAVVAVHALPWVTGQIVDCDGGLSRVSPIDPAAGRPSRRRRDRNPIADRYSGQRRSSWAANSAPSGVNIAGFSPLMTRPCRTRLEMTSSR